MDEDAGRPGTSRFANLALALVSTLLALGVAEVALRVYGLMPDYWDWHGTLVELDPQLLYRLKGHSRPDLNALGYRDYEFDLEKGDRTRIVMVGDSFLFGDNVGPGQTLPKALERVLGRRYQVFNLGVAGDGPDQSYGRLLRDGLRFDPDLVILAIYAANDFNDLSKNRLYRVDGEGRVVPNPRNPVVEALPWLRTGVFVRKLLTGRGLSPAVEKQLNAVLSFDPYAPILDPDDPGAERAVALMRGVLERFRDTLAERDVEFRVLVIPSLENVQDDTRFVEWGVPKDRYFANEHLAERLCREAGIPVLGLEHSFLARNGPPLFQPGDGHLTVRGNRVAARTLARWIREEPVDQP